jgi:hypothetical protein
MNDDYRASIEKLPRLDYEKLLKDFPKSIPQLNLANEFHHRLAEYIIEFESKLDPEEEVGLRLVTFGESIIMHVNDIGYQDPSLICFYGINEEGKPMQLIQHVSQISFLLTAENQKDKSRPRIGYKLKQQLENKEEKEGI